MKRVAEVLAATLFAGLLATLVGRIGAFAADPAAYLWLVPAAFAGLLLTDLISGLVHWLCDTFGREDTPVVGPLLIEPFREHHRDPLAMTRRGLLRVNHANCVGIVVVLGVCLWLTEPRPGDSSSLLGQAFLFFFSCAVYLTNAFHKWAHMPRPPAVARALQGIGIAITPAHHARHHDAGREAYCITTGWLNPLLDRCRIFPALERVLVAPSGSRQQPSSRARAPARSGMPIRKSPRRPGTSPPRCPASRGTSPQPGR